MSQTQRILITGANGYLGAQLSLFLAKEGNLVTALCYPLLPKDESWISLMERVLVGSIAERKTVDQLKEYTFDSIIHLVSMDHHQSQNASPEMATEVNMLPAWMLLDAFKDRGLKTFLYLSTIHVYGKIPEISITENQNLKPGNIYALTHVLSEQICDYFNRNSEVNCLNIRLSNSYGDPVFPDNNCWWLAVNDLCRTAFLENKIVLLSDGSPQRDFIHGSDVCQAVDILLKKAPKTWDKNTYHISSSETYTLMELAGFVREVYLEMYGRLIPVSTPTVSEVSDFGVFSNHERYRIDHSALKDLGFMPRCDIKEGIRRLFHYFEKNLNHA